MRPSGQIAGTHALLDAVLIEAGCRGRTAVQCRVAQPGGSGVLEREASIGKSDVVTRPLTAVAIATLRIAFCRSELLPRLEVIRHQLMPPQQLVEIRNRMARDL